MRRRALPRYRLPFGFYLARSPEEAPQEEADELEAADEADELEAADAAADEQLEELELEELEPLELEQLEELELAEEEEIQDEGEN